MSATHDSHLQHHFESPEQQLEASKLGMWIFLATEILLFGGLLCAFVVGRVAHPEGFSWAHRLLDRNLGAINTVILITSSATMAAAVRCAQLSRRRALVLMLGLTLLGGCGFMGIKAVEYATKFRHGLLWGPRFSPDAGTLAEHFGETAPAPARTEAPSAIQAGDADRGKPVFLGTCASCHGLEGGGVKGQGANLAASAYVASHGEDELLAFVKKGRQSFDADSTMHLTMPARGGNPALTDQNLRDAVSYIVRLRATAATAKAQPAPTAQAAIAAPAAPDNDQPRLVDGVLWVPHSVIPDSARGPAGRRIVASAKVGGTKMPEGAHLFFSLYFLLTGLHGLHVLAGMGVIAMLLVRALRGHFGAAYYTPVDLGGLYWHLVDLIWIFLFPLLYLVG